MLRRYAKIQTELKLHLVIGVYGNQVANGAQHLREKVNKICLIKKKQERKGFRSMIARSFIKSIESNQIN